MVRNDLEAVSEPCDLRARVTAHSRGIQDSGSSLRDRFSLFQFHKVIHVYEKERAISYLHYICTELAGAL